MTGLDRNSVRRTALLAGAALIAGLLPLASAGTAAADDPAPVAVDRFEGEVPFAGQPAEGIFTWGGDSRRPADARADRRVRRPEGAKVLAATTTSAATAGSPTTSPPTSRPTTGPRTRASGSGGTASDTGRKRIAFEIKDGGANGEASELWTTSFTDDWHRLETGRDPVHRVHLSHATTSRSAASTRSSA